MVSTWGCLWDNMDMYVHEICFRGTTHLLIHARAKLPELSFCFLVIIMEASMQNDALRYGVVNDIIRDISEQKVRYGVEFSNTSIKNYFHRSWPQVGFSSWRTIKQQKQQLYILQRKVKGNQISPGIKIFCSHICYRLSILPMNEVYTQDTTATKERFLLTVNWARTTQYKC